MANQFTTTTTAIIESRYHDFSKLIKALQQVAHCCSPARHCFKSLVTLNTWPQIILIDSMSY